LGFTELIDKARNPLLADKYRTEGETMRKQVVKAPAQIKEGDVGIEEILNVVLG